MSRRLRRFRLVPSSTSGSPVARAVALTSVDCVLPASALRAELIETVERRAAGGNERRSVEQNARRADTFSRSAADPKGRREWNLDTGVHHIRAVVRSTRMSSGVRRGAARGERRPGPMSSDAMSRADLIALASPPCGECGAPVQRVETRWHLDEDSRWRLGPCFMVCADEHRALVQPF